MRRDPSGWPLPVAAIPQPRGTSSDTGWELHPHGLSDTLLWLHQRYGGLPLYVTENGARGTGSTVSENDYMSARRHDVQSM